MIAGFDSHVDLSGLPVWYSWEVEIYEADTSKIVAEVIPGLNTPLMG